MYQFGYDFVIERPIKRLNHRRNQLHRVMRRIELALLLRGVDGELLEEIFVDASDKIFLLAKLLVADFIDLIDQRASGCRLYVPSVNEGSSKKAA